MVDHPDMQDDFVDLAKKNHQSSFHNEKLALCGLLVLLFIGGIFYFVLRSMAYVKKDKGERSPINTFGPLHIS